MCGIFGYIGKESIREVVKGIKKLEYRGYDSAGIAFIGDNVGDGEGVKKYDGISSIKSRGDIEKLKEIIRSVSPQSDVAIAHTRWATHGCPNLTNCHPHISSDGKWAIVHNGIIENYQDLKKQLDPQKIKSDTDSEIIVHLLEKFFNGNVLQTLKNVCDMLRGSFALAVISSHQRDSIFVAKRNSPIVIGLNKNFSCVCSDINSLPKIREVYLLKDNQFAQLTKGKANVYDETLKKVKLKNMANLIQESEVSLGRYQHFMLKEIDEEPEKLLKTIESYNTFEKIRKALPLKVARGVKRVVFIGCGTAYHAGLIGQYLFKEIGLDARCEIASEFRYSPLSFDKHTLAIFISQSGETADTIKALDYCKEKGINTLAITNVKNSTITFKADRNIYTQAGIEIGVASTKAYLCQVELVYLLSSYFKGIKEKNKSIVEKQAKELEDFAKDICINKIKPICKKIASEIMHAKNIFIVGRGIDYFIAQEASLKIKEITYINCQACAAGELKHGTISLIDEDVFVLALSSQEFLKEKTFNNVNEIRSRNGKVIVFSPFKIKEKGLFRFVKLPQIKEKYFSLYLIIYFQLLAYYTSKKLGHNPDKPRSLAKSVTVE